MNFFLSFCKPPSSKGINDVPFDIRQGRPSDVSEKAALMEVGGEELPIYCWADPIGFFNKNDHSYSHIIGLRFKYIKSNKTDTVYYENMEVRNKKIKISMQEMEMLPSHSRSVIHIKNDNDTLTFFPVLEDETLKGVFNNITYKYLPVVNYNANISKLIYNGYVSINIDNLNNLYQVRLLRKNSVVFQYKLCKECLDHSLDLSFMDITDGKIYLINQDCYLEPLDRKALLEFLQEEYR